MRVKLLIALAVASVFLLACILPAGAVEGVNVKPDVGTLVFQAPTSPITPQAFSEPSTVEICPPVGTVNSISANTVDLAPPNIAAFIALGTPEAPGFCPPDFEGAQVCCPPFEVPEFSFPHFFDP